MGGGENLKRDLFIHKRILHLIGINYALVLHVYMKQRGLFLQIYIWYLAGCVPPTYDAGFLGLIYSETQCARLTCY